MNPQDTMAQGIDLPYCEWPGFHFPALQLYIMLPKQVTAMVWKLRIQRIPQGGSISESRKEEIHK